MKTKRDKEGGGLNESEISSVSGGSERLSVTAGRCSGKLLGNALAMFVTVWFKAAVFTKSVVVDTLEEVYKMAAEEGNRVRDKFMKKINEGR